MLLVALVVGLFGGLGCSDDDEGSAPRPDGGTSSSTLGESTTAVAAGTDEVGSTQPAAEPTVAEAGGWRLVVTQPTAGATIGPVMTLCVEVAGTGRESVVVLEVVQQPAGSPAGGETVEVNGSVGRSAVDVEMPRAVPGLYDVDVQLIADGRRIDGVAVRISGLTLAEDASAVSCG